MGRWGAWVSRKEREAIISFSRAPYALAAFNFSGSQQTFRVPSAPVGDLRGSGSGAVAGELVGLEPQRYDLAQGDPNMKRPLFGGVEAGGTKFVCGLAREPQQILEMASIPTRDPISTLAAVTAFFTEAGARHGEIEAFGLASFGPLDLDPRSATFGALANTPKPGWRNYDLRGALWRAFGRPVAIVTDVAGAGVAEAVYGAGHGVRSLIYVTVGTGIGGALILDGFPLPVPGHAEMGHIAARRHADDLLFASACPFHADCLEGMASGRAIQARYGARLSDLPASSPALGVIADYLGQLCRALALVVAPERIVLGGGVMATPFLLERVRQEVLRQNNGYVRSLNDVGALERMIVSPALGDRSGLTGALALAQSAASGGRHA